VDEGDKKLKNADKARKSRKIIWY